MRAKGGNGFGFAEHSGVTILGNEIVLAPWESVDLGENLNELLIERSGGIIGNHFQGDYMPPYQIRVRCGPYGL